MLQEPGLSGLEALLVSDSQLGRIDARLAWYGRKVLAGAACLSQEDGEGGVTYHALSNLQVLRRIGV
eukprot:5842034-Alexandrium_andersonii.AAC.1